MKKLVLLLTGLFAYTALQAQWVDDPVNNNFLANVSSYGGEIYLSTNEVTGDTYVQWNASGSNGWGPTIQRLSFDGTPQWGTEGIRITSHDFLSSSEGVAMCTTADNAVVSCFATATDQTYAVKITADATYPWGEQGVLLFDGRGYSRTELLAGDDGGVWALGFEYFHHYLQYINADGTLNPTIIIDGAGYDEMYGKLTLGVGNVAFLTYERVPENHGMWTEKEMFLVGYTPDGTQIGPEVQLMSAQSFQITYLHHAVPDGLGGGYAYIWHSGIGGVFNTYVFHYDANGFSTISDLNGVAVHSMDPMNEYLDAYVTVDPVSHDLIIAYIQVDASTQTQNRIMLNRITATGERVWGEGIMVADYVGSEYSGLRVDAFEDGSGFALMYVKGAASNSYYTTVEAIGFDMAANVLWNKTLCSSIYSRTFCRNSAGFHMGQDIVAWVNATDGGLYGQNIGPDGTLGPIEPPVIVCDAPKNFEGIYFYEDETQTYGVRLSWEAPETQPLHYNLYRSDINVKENIVIQVPGEATSYFDETAIGYYSYKLTAVYEDCESEYALTPEGADHVDVIVTSVAENTKDEIVTVVNVYSMNGQRIGDVELSELNTGVYIIQGLTQDGRLVSRKMVVNKK